MKQPIIDIEFPIEKVRRQFNDLKRKQMPFAMALAITQTAKDARESIRKEMSAEMQLRSNFLTRASQLQVISANKNDGLHRMKAIIGHKHWAMAQQMGNQSVTRTPNRARYLFKPIAVKRTKTGRIPKRLKPSHVLDQKNVYLHKGPKGPAIYQHYGQGKQSRRLLYVLVRHQKINPAMSMSKTVSKVTAKQLSKNFGSAMRRALRTRKR